MAADQSAAKITATPTGAAGPQPPVLPPPSATAEVDRRGRSVCAAVRSADRAVIRQARATACLSSAVRAGQRARQRALNPGGRVLQAQRAQHRRRQAPPPESCRTAARDSNPGVLKVFWILTPRQSLEIWAHLHRPTRAGVNRAR